MLRTSIVAFTADRKGEPVLKKLANALRHANFTPACYPLPSETCTELDAEWFIRLSPSDQLTDDDMSILEHVFGGVLSDD